MTPTDWRALCAELLDEVAARPLLLDRELVARARAALAETEPAVVGPTDEELDAWITECADATRYGPLEHYWAFDVRFDHVRDIARAVLARFGHQPTPPAAEEVAEVVADLRECAVSCTLDSKNYWAAPMRRAADLLERQAAPVPVAVSERSGQIEDLAADAVGALRYIEQTHGRLYGVGWDRVYEKVERLNPSHALPLPSGEVQP